MAKLIFLLGSKISRVPRHHNDHWWVGLSPAPRRGAQLWPGLAARELTRYPVAWLRMINTSLVGGCFSHPPDYVMALSANLERQRWCDPRYCRRGLLQFWLAAAADVAVATRHTAGVLWSWALGPACVRQVSSVLAIGWWGASMAWHAACTWRLLFFRPSTAAASLPRLNTFFTGYHWFTSMRDGRGPVTELSADGARPSVNVPTPWREATSAVAEVWFGDACALYLVQHVGGSVAHTDHDLAFGYVSSAYGARTLPPATHSGGPRLWQHTSTHTHTVFPLQRIWCLFEVYQTISLSRSEHFHGLLLCTSTGVLQQGNAGTDVAVAVAKTVAELDARSAKATDEEDRLMIHSLIENMPGGFDTMNSFVRDTICSALEASHLHYESTFKTLVKNLTSRDSSSRSTPSPRSAPLPTLLTSVVRQPETKVDTN